MSMLSTNSSHLSSRPTTSTRTKSDSNSSASSISDQSAQYQENGVAVIASAPAVGTGAAIGASNWYDGSAPDTAIDNWVDNTLEPAVAGAINTSIDAYESTTSWAGETYESTKSRGESIVDSVKSWFR